MKNLRHRASRLSKPALLVALLCMVAVASALNVVNTHTTSGQILNPFSVGMQATYKHEALAPSQGNITSLIETSIQIDDIFVENGACTTHNVTLGPGVRSYTLNSLASVTSGTAKAAVHSNEIASLCGSGGGN
ncbi:hypothetical protein IT157_08360 [bacterium]|nr:hypothetical protein [bacterium]